MTVVWSFPTRIVFGAGTSAQAGLEAKSTGGDHALIVTDRGVREAGLVPAIVESLKKARITSEIFDEVSTNPLEEEVVNATRAFQETEADLIVGLGGGSALDVAKLVRLMAGHPPPLAQYDLLREGTDLIVHGLPPMVAIPTTAGTGSEANRSAVVRLEETGEKTTIFSPRLMPNVAILDPELTTSMPPKVTASTGFEAFTHCVEAYCAKGDHPMADAIALEGIELVARNLERAVTEGKSLEARGNMMKAAVMGAVASQKGLGACHALAHPLSAKVGLHHGLASALCLPAVLDYNRASVPDRIARIARILGVRGDDEETLCFECSGGIRALRRKVGLPEGLAAVGVEEDLLGELAQRAMEDPIHKSNPRACTEEDLLALYRASM